MAKTLQRITPFLWFDSQAEEAAKFYASIFKNSRVVSTSRYDEEASRVSGRPKGSVMTVAFELDGQEFTALNGGPLFSSPRRPRSSSTAKPRERSIISGTSSRRAVRRSSAAGSRTASVSRGRWSRPF